MKADTRLLHIADNLTDINLIIYGQVAAGYPAEAYNYTEDRIDLNKYIIRNHSQTKCLWATHIRLTGEGIDLTDLLVIDSGIKPTENSIQLYWYDGEFILARLKKETDHAILTPLNPEVKPITIYPEENIQSKGVLTHAIKKFSVYQESFGGYPVDVENYIETGMDFNVYTYGDWWETCFFLWCGGDSMIGDGIFKKDLLVIDGLKEPHKDSIIVISLNREYTMKRIEVHKDHLKLVSSNPEMPPIRVNSYDDFDIIGTLTCVIKKFI